MAAVVVAVTVVAATVVAVTVVAVLVVAATVVEVIEVEVIVMEVIVAEVVAAAALWAGGNEFVPSMIRRKSLRWEKRGRMAVGAAVGAATNCMPIRRGRRARAMTIS